MTLLELSLLELIQALAARRASPVELMQATLQRVAETHEALNAVVALHGEEQLLEAARQSEARIQRGEARPLEGIPLGVKDLEHAAGLVTSYGSLPFKAHVPERDSTQVARLKAAGAIVVGKTNAPEFGYTAITKNLVYGVTNSPWDITRSPGGSSGGSSAALSGGVLPLVTASDGGGSIRIPASFTGAVGLKPSYGRVPRGPIERWDHTATSVYGPLTKTVADAALVLDLTHGADPRDPHSLPKAELSFLAELERPLTRLKIGYSADLGYAVVQSDVAQIVEDAAKLFEQLGHQVEAIRGGPPDLGTDWGIVNAFELGGWLEEILRDRSHELTRSLLSGIEFAAGLTPGFWANMAKRRAELVAWVASTFERYDLLLTPTCPFDPPPAKGPFPKQTEGRPQSATGVAAFTIPFNLSWNPAISVRAGKSKAGLPVGLQLVGPQHGDALVLRAAHAFELERPWHPDWPRI